MIPDPVQQLDAAAPGWAALYPRHLLLDSEMLTKDSYWFRDALHHPRPLPPLATIVCEAVQFGLSHATTRLLVIPGTNGITQKILGGWVYLAPVPPTPELEIEKVEFARRYKQCISQWPSLVQAWVHDIEKLIGDTSRLSFSIPPAFEPKGPEADNLGNTLGLSLFSNSQSLFANYFKAWILHFSLLNVAYTAQSLFIQRFRGAFERITANGIGRLFPPVESVLHHPSRVLKALALDAIHQSLAETILRANNFFEARTLLEGTHHGRGWLERLEASRVAWFTFRDGTGFYPDEATWDEDTELLLNLIKSSITAELTDPGNRPLSPETVDIEHYLDLLPDLDERRSIRLLYEDARLTCAFLEDHNLYVEHRFNSVFWRKIKELGIVLSSSGLLADEKDIHLFSWYEVLQITLDFLSGWATRDVRFRRSYWSTCASDRARVFKLAGQWRPPSSLGQAPMDHPDPFVRVLFGPLAVNEHVEGTSGVLRGIGVCGNKVYGEAFLPVTSEPFPYVPTGTVILVVPHLSVAFLPILLRVQGVIAETGGILSHGAVLCRELGIPCVVGVTGALNGIRNGDRITLDPEVGTVTVG